MGLQRNVCVALGNIGDPAAVPALVHALTGLEPLVLGHAAWALGRIGSSEARDALRSAARSEDDSSALEEIVRSLAEMTVPASR